MTFVSQLSKSNLVFIPKSRDWGVAQSQDLGIEMRP